MEQGNKSIVQVFASSTNNQRKKQTLSRGMACLLGDQPSLTQSPTIGGRMEETPNLISNMSRCQGAATHNQDLGKVS
jgi:hypothetical protein